MKKIRSYSNFKPKKSDIEQKSKQRSVQGDADSIKDLLIKHTQGIIEPSALKPGVFLDDPDHDDVDFQELMRLDMAELEELQQQNADLLNEMKIKIKNHSEALSKSASDATKANEAKGKSEPVGNIGGSEADDSKPPGEAKD